MDDLIERKQDDLDRLTIAVANGFAISMSAEAQAKWNAEHAPKVEHSPEEIARQSMTLARLAGYSWPGGKAPITRKTN